MYGSGDAVEHPRALAGNPPLVTRQSTFAAAFLTACLLSADGGRASEIPDSGYQIGRKLDRQDVAQTAPTLPETRGRVLRADSRPSWPHLGTGRSVRITDDRPDRLGAPGHSLPGPSTRQSSARSVPKGPLWSRSPGDR
jgi:hypothetical protein